MNFKKLAHIFTEAAPQVPKSAQKSAYNYEGEHNSGIARLEDTIPLRTVSQPTSPKDISEDPRNHLQ